jgi:hypothetical protein
MKSKYSTTRVNAQSPPSGGNNWHLSSGPPQRGPSGAIPGASPGPDALSRGPAEESFGGAGRWAAPRRAAKWIGRLLAGCAPGPPRPIFILWATFGVLAPLWGGTFQFVFFIQFLEKLLDHSSGRVKFTSADAAGGGVCALERHCWALAQGLSGLGVQGGRRGGLVF